MLNRARRAGFVRFDAIRDDGVDMRAPTAWNDADHLVTAIRNTIADFRLDRQQGQPRRLLFAVEAAGMLPQIEWIAGSYGIPVQSSGGFDSLTAKYGLAEFLGGSPAAEVLHIGDHDPSGVHVFSSLAEDVRAICADSEYEVDVTFTRLAVTPAQITTLGLPTAPPKATDKRSFDGEETMQAEAIPPDLLADIVQQAIDDRMDQAGGGRCEPPRSAPRRPCSAGLPASDRAGTANKLRTMRQIRAKRISLSMPHRRRNRYRRSQHACDRKNTSLVVLIEI